jgi:nicotinate-nucleotide pyrophosphorylase (carboxylating)
MFMPRKILEEKLLKLLAEDTAQGDVTTAAIIPSGKKAQAKIIAKEDAVAAGIEESAILADALELKIKTEVADGDEISKDQIIIRLSGDAQTLLAAERTILNLVSRMSGIATTTKHLKEKLRNAGLNPRIAATRKTAPGLSYFDKKSVLIGGGDPHRLHLDDMILIKDNHIAIIGSVEAAVRKAKENASFSKKIEVEVTRVEDVIVAAEAGADVIMLDNFSPKRIREAVEWLERDSLRGKVILEASGGISAQNIVDYGSTNVDVLSIGELTHSARAIDVSLEIVIEERKK